MSIVPRNIVHGHMFQGLSQSSQEVPRDHILLAVGRPLDQIDTLAAVPALGEG